MLQNCAAVKCVSSSKTDQWQLRTLPFEHRLVVFQMRELDPRAGGEAPFERGGERLALGAGIEAKAFVPEAALRDSHISHAPSVSDGSELLETVGEGDGSWRL
jgi:hypothetical protein